MSDELDALQHLLRYNVAEMRRRRAHPAAYADPLRVAEERRLALDLRALMARTNLRDISDRAGAAAFGFRAPLALIDHVKFPPRAMELAINADVQYKVRGADLFVAVAPSLPPDADAFSPLSPGWRRLLRYAAVVILCTLGFFAILWLLEGPPRMGIFLAGAILLYVMIVVSWTLLHRAIINAHLASLDLLVVKTAEDDLL